MTRSDSAISFWKDQRFVVTGGAGFVGRWVVRGLHKRGAEHVIVPRSADYDLRQREAIIALLDQARPDIVIHLAALVGGIGFNQRHPADLFYDNLMMGTQLLHEAYHRGVKKFVAIGTVCAYPNHTPLPFHEATLWEGYPEATNAPYGLAKKMLLVQAQAYRQQYGLNAIYLIPTNVYGPGDNFDPHSSHVLPAIIHKCYLAKQHGEPHITLWGSGAATRDWIYVGDVAEAILLATEHYNAADPVNLGSGQETSIQQAAELVCEALDYHGSIRWDTSRPDGQPRRVLDTQRAHTQFGFQATMALRGGLQHTIRWYTDQVGIR